MSAPTLSPGLSDALHRWLTHIATIEGRAAATVEAYQRDVLGFLAFQQSHIGDSFGVGALARLSIRDMRAWMAHERDRGVAARSLARSLSAVKTFAGWLAERDNFDVTAVLATRSPKFRRKLPRPLSPTDAKAVIDRLDVNSDTPWVAARDAAVVTLLYGSGLRISEALSLNGADWPMGDTLRIIGKGNKEREVPLLHVTRDAIAAYLKASPHPLEPAAPAVPRRSRWRSEPAHSARGRRTGPHPIGPACKCHTARHAPLFRDPPAKCRWRPARYPGTAGPCVLVDHPSLHSRRYRADD